jgi:hypothetical protein
MKTSQVVDREITTHVGPESSSASAKFQECLIDFVHHDLGWLLRERSFRLLAASAMPHNRR